jgi:hypothetical protein
MGYITQELFNRMIECDADFQDTNNNFSLVDWANGPPTVLPSDTKSNESNFGTDVHLMSSLSNGSDKISSKWFYKQGVFGSWTQCYNLAGQLFYPQQYINMDFLQQNIILGLATSTDKQNIIAKTEIQSNLFQAHLDGRAIDIVIPEKGTSTCLYLNANWLDMDSNGNVLNTISYNDSFYTYIENLFTTHFDIVKVHNNIIIDLTKFNIKFPKQANPTQYLARVYHLEVSSQRYLQLQTELFSNGPATNAVVRLS